MVAKPRSSHARISTFGAPSAAFGARYGSQSGTESRMSGEILPLKWRAISQSPPAHLDERRPAHAPRARRAGDRPAPADADCLFAPDSRQHDRQHETVNMIMPPAKIMHPSEPDDK